MGKMTTFISSLTPVELRTLATVASAELVARQEMAGRLVTVPEDFHKIAAAFDALISHQPIGAKPSDFRRNADGRAVVPIATTASINALEQELSTHIAAETVPVPETRGLA